MKNSKQLNLFQNFLIKSNRYIHLLRSFSIRISVCSLKSFKLLLQFFNSFEIFLNRFSMAFLF